MLDTHHEPTEKMHEDEPHVFTLLSLLLYQRDKSSAEKGWRCQETLKTKRQPWRNDKPWSKQCCLVSVHNAVTTGPDAFTNEDGSCIMIQVGFNLLLGKRARSWGKKMYHELWKLTQYITKPRGVALIFSCRELWHSLFWRIRTQVAPHTIAQENNFKSHAKQGALEVPLELGKRRRNNRIILYYSHPMLHLFFIGKERSAADWDLHAL